MESFENNIVIQQGEAWTLSLEVFGNEADGVPFIIDSARFANGNRKVAFVCTIGSTVYEKNARYVKSWWNLIDNKIYDTDDGIPCFSQTVPMINQSTKQTPEFAAGAVPTTVAAANSAYGLNNTGFEEAWNSDGTPIRRYLYQYTLLTEAVDPQLGHRPYHYFYFVSHFGGALYSQLMCNDYVCDTSFSFSEEDTSKWNGQNYMYQITLVDGRRLEDVLDNIFIDKGIPPDEWPETVKDKFMLVKAKWPSELQADIDVDSELGEIRSPEAILKPTKITVNNNLKTMI